MILNQSLPMTPDLHSKRSEIAAEIEVLNAKVADLNQKMAAIDTVIAMFPRERVRARTLAQALHDNQEDQDKGNSSLPSRVLAFLSANNSNSWTVRQIAAGIANAGDMDNPHYIIAVSTACSRLATRGMVQHEEVEGRKVYGLGRTV